MAGHIGAGLAIGAADRSINVGVWISAALLSDLVLWVLILAGVEGVRIPPDFAVTRQPQFVFPYSHGLLAALGWSVAAGLLAGVALCRRHRASCMRTAVLVSVCVLSHWLLDLIVHRSEMPLVGATSPMLGLGLWDSLAAALLLESAIVAVGIGLYLPASGLPRRRAIALAALVLVVLAMTVAGMLFGPAPPSANAMAASSLLTLLLICGLASWLGRGTGQSVPVPPA